MGYLDLLLGQISVTALVDECHCLTVGVFEDDLRRTGLLEHRVRTANEIGELARFIDAGAKCLILPAVIERYVQKHT